MESPLDGTKSIFTLYVNKSPASSVVKENTAMLFFCEAPEVFCGLT